MSSAHPRRSAVPWLYGLAAVLAVLSPFVFLLVWVLEGTLDGVVAAVVAALADLVAAAVAAVVATVLAARRGIVAVRTAVSGHPQGRAGRLAEHQAARWHLARDRFAALRSEWAAFEADRGAVARRPALTDVSVPATARFVEAYGDAEFLLTEAEPAGPRRGEFVEAVDRAEASWAEAQRVADELGAAPGHGSAAGPGDAPVGHSRGFHAAPHQGTSRAVDPPRSAGTAGRAGAPGYAEVTDAVRRAARRGVEDLRGRMRT